MPDSEVTKADLLQHIRDSYQSLQQLISTWTDQQIVTPAGPDGWSIKDHLAHLATWERGQAAMLRREDRWAAMGLTMETAIKAENTDAINKLLYAQNRDRTLAEVRAALQDAHQQLIKAVEKLTEADLRKTYSYYQPDEPGEDDGRSIVKFLIDNSYGHYEEHTPWIKALIAEQ